MSRTTLRFLHLADLHLDHSFSGGRLKLSYEKDEQRRRELRDLLGRAVELARDEGVELILIAGDLWEEESLSPETVQFTLEQLGAAGVPVVIAPGNHDYYSPASHYSSDITAARFGRSWPGNVFIFRDYELTTERLPGLDEVLVTGLAYHSNQPVVVRKLGERVPRGAPSDFPPSLAGGIKGGCLFHLAVIHGSRDDALPPGKMRTLPFSDAELLAKGFGYTALGHYHARSEISDGQGRVRAAYPGSAAALSVDEGGEHGVLIGTMREGGVSPDELRFVELDRRRIHRLKVDVTGQTRPEGVEAKIASTAGEAGVRPEDMLLVELTGTYPQGSRIGIDDQFTRDLCWHARIETGALLPEWDIMPREELNPRTTEALFRSRIQRMIDDAAARGEEAEMRRLRNAMYYGLDALHGRPLTPRKV